MLIEYVWKRLNALISKLPFARILVFNIVWKFRKFAFVSDATKFDDLFPMKIKNKFQVKEFIKLKFDILI